VNDGYVDSIATILGMPTSAADVVLASPDLVDPNFVKAGPGQYSYVFEGSAQSLDHILVSSSAASLLVDLQHARVNADFPETLRAAFDPATGIIRPERLSDHDPVVAYFTFQADSVAPVIANVPSNQTATAASPAGAVVSWPPPTATDNVDGQVGVTCAPPSGSTFGIGVTTVTCTATDRSGSSASASFTTTVVDPRTPGSLTGVGRIGASPARVSFAFTAFEGRSFQTGVAAIPSQRNGGFDTFVTLQSNVVFFFAGGRAVALSGTGLWNGQAGHGFEIMAQDNGEPGCLRDAFSVVIRNPAGQEVLRTGGVLQDGDIQ
jgi:hypothetical protein